MYNPNMALAIQMNQIEASIVYENDNALSLTCMDDFELGFRERRDVYLKFVTTGNEVNDQPIVEYPVLKEIENDIRRRNLRFRMKLDARITYGIEFLGWRTVSMMMNSYIVDLNVNIGDHHDSPMDGSNLIMMVTD
ncbi:hypothetical protein COLO4_11689 [Corchorus olitorius]|uniref:Uncharacterized protein n=1 Tax=Corchorus olitorius TaxID=93759 RepID=A0A1R3K3J5_9ROSI|nr:hypothetical protein COLO4_11689 [Corchorus olitorius]